MAETRRIIIPWWTKVCTLATLFCALAAAGCADNPGTPKNDTSKALTVQPPVDPAVATVNGKAISYDQLSRPLIDTYGLNLLLQIVQLELARQNVEKAGVKIVPADLERERQIILKGAFPDADPKDYDSLLVQLLTRQNITQAQWSILLNTNACLRKLAEPMCSGKITEETIQQAFDLQYGAQVKIRDIQVANIQDAQDVKRRLAAGEKFEDVARALSQDPRTAAVGGDRPAFSANNSTISPLIKEQAFSLKPGEVSDALNTGNAFHIIKVEKRIAPFAAKLDAHTHQYLQQTLTENLVQEYVKALRNQLGQQATRAEILQITDPELKRQFDQKVAEHNAQMKEEDDSRRAQLMQRAAAATQPTRPAAVERPPATRSGPATLPAAPDHKPPPVAKP